mmetsp:Transcript_104017/g.303666  ORF Transcript_104017/g.303666 Transcript_104017/m.303666 type:complete len:272 (+) Transcript_104017:386-1201(+)
MLVAPCAAHLCGGNVAYVQGPRLLGDIVYVSLKVGALRGELGAHGLETPRAVLAIGNVHDCYGLVEAQPEHAEVHLATALVVADLELEETYACQHAGRVGGELKYLLEIHLLVEEKRGVVFAYEDGHSLEAGVICLQEKGSDIPGRVGSVEAVDKPCLVRGPEVIPGDIAVELWTLHGKPQFPHLSKAGMVLEAGTQRALRKGEGHREVGQPPHDARFPLGVEHGVQCAQLRHQEVRGRSRGSLDEAGLHLEVRLVHQDHGPQRWMVSPRG